MAVAAAMLGAAPSLAPAQPAISNGGYRIGADAMWSRGVDGRGQTVAVLDVGFGGLDESVRAGELPATGIEQVSFDTEFGIEGRNAVGAPTQHGTRVAEALHDVAPGATLLLVNYNTHAQFRQAVDWLISRRAPVVAHANSFLLPPFDGTGPNAAAVDRAAAAGILWVNSAGNFARRHWSGTVREAPTVLPFDVAAGGILSFSVAPFGGPDDRVLLEVQQSMGDGPWITRTGVESGPEGALSEVQVSTGGRWRVAVSRTEGADVFTRVFSRTPGLGAHAVPTGSIPTPGDAAGSLSVGAVRWTGTALADYSSRGPTQDGRAKPDLVGPTYVTANPAWPGSAGTSAAAAHTAGAAALLRAARQRQGLPVHGAALRAALVASAADLGDPGPDLLFGAGMVRLDTAPPRLRVAVTDDRRPVVSGFALDEGTLDTIVVSVDGRRVRRVRAARFRVRLPRLAAGRHRMVVEASDMAGNRVTKGLWVRVAR
jgi:hypothetical protein